MEQNRYRRNRYSRVDASASLQDDASSPLRNFARRNLFWIVILCISVAALGLRISTYYFRSFDFNIFLNGWFSELQTKGLGVNPARCNYNLPYLTVLYILGRISDNALGAIKAFSIVFDFAMAASGTWLISNLIPPPSRHRRLLCTLAYTTLLLLPEVLLNSGIWAQCDSVYTTFILLGITFLLRRNMPPAFLLMGLALAFKLQAVFLLPLFVLVWLSDKKCHLLHFLLIPGTMLVCGIPAAFAGRSIWEVFTIYLKKQVGESTLLNANCPNLYTFMTSNAPYEIFNRFGIILTLILMGLAAAAVLRIRRRLAPEEQLLLGVWCSFVCIFCLPNMHERYTYGMDILLVILALFTRRRGDLLCAATSMAISTITGTNVLFQMETLPNWAAALIRLGCLLYLTARVLSRLAPELLERVHPHRHTGHPNIE